MPLGLFLALAAGLVAPVLGSGEREIDDLIAGIEPPNLRVLAQASDQNDFVAAARHPALLAAASVSAIRRPSETDDRPSGPPLDRPAALEPSAANICPLVDAVSDR